MDEPFGALDAQTRCSMQAHLLRIWERVDVTVLFITHDLDEAVYLSDRIIVLGARPGRIQEIIDVPVARPRVHHPRDAEDDRQPRGGEKQRRGARQSGKELHQVNAHQADSVIGGGLSGKQQTAA
jgi:ABC-type sulfate/molybdate transport systems ATPase subunit